MAEHPSSATASVAREWPSREQLASYGICAEAGCDGRKVYSYVLKAGSFGMASRIVLQPLCL